MHGRQGADRARVSIDSRCLGALGDDDALSAFKRWPTAQILMGIA
jgi:hypothetical protein